MNMQVTSLVAYLQLQPKLGARQTQVYCMIQRFSDRNKVCGVWADAVTNMELSELLGWSINRVTPRVKELREQGLVTKHDTRTCRVTGNNANTWAITGGVTDGCKRTE